MVQEVSRRRKKAAWFISGLTAVIFALTVSLIVEARRSDFYGGPLLPKMATVLDVKLNGLPDDPDERARVITGIPNLYYLPPEAVLPKAPAARFKRIGLRLGYLAEDASLGEGRYICRASDIDKIPLTVFNIAMALERIPENILKTMKFEYIVFCGDLLADSKRVGGFAAPPNNLMFMNLTRRTSDEKIQDLFFHEFYHLFESRFRLVKDQKWMQFFGTGYQNSYAGIGRPHRSAFGTGGPGFINMYSRSYPHEDRAEIFAALMLYEEKLVHYILRQRDDMLAAKTQYIAETARDKLGIKIGPLW